MNSKHSWSYGLLALGILLLAIMIMDFNGRVADLRTLNAEKIEVQARLNQQLQTQVALQTQIAYAESDSAVAQWAYDSGNLGQPGDVLVVPIEAPGILPEATPIAEPEPVPSTHTQNWFNLFFGPVAP